MEGNPSAVYFINRYVQTGKKEYLDFLVDKQSEVINETSTDSLSNKITSDFYTFCKNLYLLNIDLPQDKKIKIVAIDAESFFCSKYLIEDIVKRTSSIPLECKETITTLKNFQGKEFAVFISKTERRRIGEIQKKLSIQINNHRKIFEDTFKEDMLWIDLLVFNMASRKRIDYNLLKNFKIVLKSSGPNNKYYFQYGRLHAELRKNTLSYYLNQSSEFKGRVIAAGTQYTNCEFWFGKTFY